MKTAISLPQDQIVDFCAQWKVAELSLFGSVIREDFYPHNDIDILIAFVPEANWGLLEHVQMQ